MNDTSTLQIVDNEGERVVVLLDVYDVSELEDLFSREDESVMDILFDQPFFAMTVEDYEGDVGSLEGADVVEMTYEEWMCDNRQWANE